MVCFFQAEDGIRDLVRSRGLGDVYKRQCEDYRVGAHMFGDNPAELHGGEFFSRRFATGDHLSLIHI